LAEASPTATPSSTREMQSVASSGEAALPKAPTMKTAAEMMMMRRRP
jgi:hypothetical protein